MANFSHLVSPLRRRAVPAAITVLAAIAVGGLHILLSQPVYRTSTRLIIDEQAVSLSEIGQAINESQSSIPSGGSLIATQAELIKSERVLARAIEDIKSDLSSQEPQEITKLPTPAMLQENLTVSVLPATNILELSFVHADPEVAAFVLNKIADAVVVEGAESIRSQATSVRKFLEDEIPQQADKLLDIEQAESRYRQETGIVSLAVQTENLVERLTDVQTQELNLLSQLRAARSQEAILQDITGVENVGRAYTTVRAGQNAAINQLEAQLVEIESLASETGSILGPQHPDMAELLARRDELRGLYAQAVSRFIPDSAIATPNPRASEDISQTLVAQYITEQIAQETLEGTLATVQAERSQLERNLSFVPERQRSLLTLVRDREEATNTLSLLRSKLEEARLAEAQVANTIRIASTAQVPEAAKGSPLAILAISAAAGALLATGIVVFLETIDDCLHNVEDLEALVDLPVFGILPKGLPNSPAPKSLKIFLQDSQWIESYRLLFKALDFYAERHPTIQSGLFVLAGLQEEDGQTLATANLAAVAARLHRKSLVIDANWQQPFQHLFFGVSPRPGLVQLSDRFSSPESPPALNDVQSSPVSNVDVLPYGVTSQQTTMENVSETPEIAALLAIASEKYDFTAVVAPAVESCADAAALSSHGAGLILVVQAHVTSKSLLKRSLKKLAQSGTPVVGFVMAQTPDVVELDYLSEAPTPAAFSLGKLQRSQLAINTRR